MGGGERVRRLLATWAFLPSSPTALGAPILEPNLDLALRERKSLRQPRPLGSREVLRRLERLLQLGDLSPRESRTAFLRVLLALLPACSPFLSLSIRLGREGVGGERCGWVRGIDESRRVAHTPIVKTVTHGRIVANCSE